MNNPQRSDSGPLNPLDSVGGEPLSGSGFENESPTPEFAETDNDEDDSNRADHHN